jgi:hypothetical protein
MRHVGIIMEGTYLARQLEEAWAKCKIYTSHMSGGDPGGYWWPPTYSNWLLLTVFSLAHSFVLICNCGFYTSVIF